MKKQRRKSNLCPNCQTPLVSGENYCPQCGQENSNKDVSLKILISDFIEDYFTFDSKFFNSLRPLIFKPGEMTRHFLDGKRKRYIQPIRLFLFLSFIYFGLAYLGSGDWTSSIIIDGDEPNQEQTKLFYEALKRNVNVLVFFFTPFQALLVMLFFRSEKRNHYASYFVWTLHIFSLWLIIGILRLGIGLVFQEIESDTAYYAELVISFLLFIYLLRYAYLSLLRVFEKPYTWFRFILLIVLSSALFVLLALIWILFLARFYELI